MSETKIMYRKNNAVICAGFEDGAMTKLSVGEWNPGLTVGDMYVGRIESIVEGIHGAFVSVGGDSNCFLKFDRATNPICKMMHADGKLHTGDELLVQIEKEAGKNKPASVVADFSITGVNLVLIHGTANVLFSSKITDAAWKNKMRPIAEQWIDGTYSVMLRTNSYTASEDELLQEMMTLKTIYHTVTNTCKTRTKGTCLYHGTPEFLCELRDDYTEFPESIITDDPEMYEKILDFTKQFRPKYTDSVTLLNDGYPLELRYKMNANLKDVTNRKVWLKSGAYLVIDPTEAMTVIDVNTGKASAGKTVRNSFLECNLEAAKEIARQIRVRNLSGIIMVDFIDMKDPSEQAILLKELRKLTESDPIKTVVVDMTKLNLVEITRLKKRKPVKEAMRDLEV